MPLRRKKKRIRITSVEVPPELKLDISISGIKEVKETKTITLRKVAKREEEPEEITKEKLEKLEVKKKKKEKIKFELPRLLIKLAVLEGHVPEESLLTTPYHPPGADFTTIYITKDKRYLVKDPFITRSELVKMENTLTRLFFLTESEVLTEAIRNPSYLDQLLNDLGLPSKLRYLVKREIFGYGILDPLIRDPNLQDIIIPSANVPAKVIHRQYGELITNIVFTQRELDLYIEKLIAKANKTVSLFSPLASVQLPEGHRLTVSYKSEVTTKGSSMVIRKFPEKPWSIAALLQNNTLSPEIAAWLMLLIENKKGVLVVGPMGSGKTSLTNALCNFIGEHATIVTIEDTPELRLAHKYWIQHKTREALTLTRLGSIGMFDLVKHALRESADYVIVGEVRGEEGRIWAQALATGHGGITTFHAESHIAAIARLTSPPISIEKQMLTALKGIVLTRRYHKKIVENGVVTWKPIRRVGAVYDLKIENNEEKFTQLFKYDVSTDSFINVTPVYEAPTAIELMDVLGWNEETFIKEYEERVNILKRLQKHVQKYPASPLVSYEESTKLFWLFHESPKKAYEYIAEIERKLGGTTEEMEKGKGYELAKTIVQGDAVSNHTSVNEPVKRIRIIKE